MFRLCLILGAGGLIFAWAVLLYAAFCVDPDADFPADGTYPPPGSGRGSQHRD